MNTQPDQIQALISNIDQVLSLSNPRPPLVVLGDTVVQSRQTLEQVRHYLVHLQHQAEQKTTPQPDEGQPDVASESASIRRIVRQELNLFKTQLTQTLLAEIKLLRQERRVLIREIRELQRQRQSTAEPVPPSVSGFDPSSSTLGSPPTSASAFLSPPQPLVSETSSQTFLPYAGVELPSESALMQPNSVQSRSINLVGNLIPELNLSPSVEPMSNTEEAEVEESSQVPPVVVETPLEETEASTPPSPPAIDPVEEKPSTLVDQVLSMLDLSASSSPREPLPTSEPTQIEPNAAQATPPPMDGVEYTLASPHENLLPQDDDDDDQVDSHLLVERSTIQNLEADLLTLESNLDSSEETLPVETEANQQASEQDSSVQQPQAEDVLNFEDLFADVSFLDADPVSSESSSPMKLDELIDHLNLTDDSSSHSEVDGESPPANLEAFNQQQQT